MLLLVFNLETVYKYIKKAEGAEPEGMFYVGCWQPWQEGGGFMAPTLAGGGS